MIKNLKESLTHATVMPRWLWYTLIVAAVSFALVQWRAEGEMRERLAGYEMNRNDIEVNSERITRCEAALLDAGALSLDEVKKRRARLSEPSRRRVGATHEQRELDKGR